MTLRNPRSPFTFLNYLHSQGRLVSFINLGSTIPSRREFADYLSWAADKVQGNGVDVAYAEEVVRVAKIFVDDSFDLYEVTSRLMGSETCVTRRASKSLCHYPSSVLIHISSE